MVADQLPVRLAHEASALLRLAQEHGYRSALVVFDVPLETCIAQNAQRPPAKQVAEWFVGLQRQVLDALLPSIESEGWDELIVIGPASPEVRVDFQP